MLTSSIYTLWKRLFSHKPSTSLWRHGSVVPRYVALVVNYVLETMKTNTITRSSNVRLVVLDIRRHVALATILSKAPSFNSAIYVDRLLFVVRRLSSWSKQDLKRPLWLTETRHEKRRKDITCVYLLIVVRRLLAPRSALAMWASVQKGVKLDASRLVNLLE